jgi:hypothetical protein
MKAPAHYFTLKAAALPRIESYHRDLLVHDRREIRRKPACPFLHLTRQYGTYLTMLIPSTDYPPQGMEVPYLFGHADRWHILKERAGCMEYGKKHHPNALLHYFDGKTLRTITYDQASEIVRQYTARITAEFRQLKAVAA